MTASLGIKGVPFIIMSSLCTGTQSSLQRSKSVSSTLERKPCQICKKMHKDSAATRHMGHQLSPYLHKRPRKICCWLLKAMSYSWNAFHCISCPELSALPKIGVAFMLTDGKHHHLNLDPCLATGFYKIH